MVNDGFAFGKSIGPADFADSADFKNSFLRNWRNLRAIINSCKSPPERTGRCAIRGNFQIPEGNKKTLS